MLELEPYRAFEFYKSFLKWYCDWYNPTYLEIGCGSGEIAATLNIKSGTGVDIVEHPDWDTYVNRLDNLLYVKATSDQFFENIGDICDTQEFGLIFIDGDHTYAQVLRDVSNALACLEEGGLIVMHDTYPPTVDHTHPSWSGTAYLAAIELRKRPDLEVYTFPVTFGVTLVGKVGNTFPWVPAHD